MPILDTIQTQPLLISFSPLPGPAIPHSGSVWRQAKLARVQSCCHPEVTIHPAALWGTESHLGWLHLARHTLCGSHCALQCVREHSPGAQHSPWPTQCL
jgi:hypothetical protein